MHLVHNGEAAAPVISIEDVRKVRGPGPCRHMHILLDEFKADVECRECGARLNPVAILIRMSREESRWRQARDEFKAAHDEFKAAHDELKAAHDELNAARDEIMP